MQGEIRQRWAFFLSPSQQSAAVWKGNGLQGAASGRNLPFAIYSCCTAESNFRSLCGSLKRNKGTPRSQSGLSSLQVWEPIAPPSEYTFAQPAGLCFRRPAGRRGAEGARRGRQGFARVMALALPLGQATPARRRASPPLFFFLPGPFGSALSHSMNEAAHKVMVKVFADAAQPIPPHLAKSFLSVMGGEEARRRTPCVIVDSGKRNSIPPLPAFASCCYRGTFC